MSESSPNTPTPKDPLYNCHAHVFTGKHVPPFLARSFVPWPIWSLLRIDWVLRLYKQYLSWENQKYVYNSWRNRLKRFRQFIVTHWYTAMPSFLLQFWLVFNAVAVVLFALQRRFFESVDWTKFDEAAEVLLAWKVIWVRQGWAAWVVFILAFFLSRVFRRVFLSLGAKTFGLFAKVPGKQSMALYSRYLSLGRYANLTKQESVYKHLADQYPSNTRFVALSMDMEYMGAGLPSKEGRYLNQLEELKTLKKDDKEGLLYPFLFVDPRRIAADREGTANPPFFAWENQGGRVVLKDCVVKTCLETERWAGIKLYPALGYYPFEEDLLPLYLYAVQHQIPLLSHCVEGPMFYRKSKKKEWNYHPVFKESIGKDQEGNPQYVRLALTEKKNAEFTRNFTHPLNFWVLLDEPLLRIVVARASEEVQKLFGYQGPDAEMERGLEELKICLAHFGGEDEWVKYLDTERYYYSKQLVNNRETGLSFRNQNNDTKKINWGRLGQIYRHVDWYSIICALCLQKENVYTDVSYILSKPRIYPLLRETLDKKVNPKLRAKILYGTDFYVVRNHYSDKDLLAQINAGIPEDDFDQIACRNPVAFLHREFANIAEGG